MNSDNASGPLPFSVIAEPMQLIAESMVPAMDCLGSIRQGLSNSYMKNTFVVSRGIAAIGITSGARSCRMRCSPTSLYRQIFQAESRRSRSGILN